MAIEELEQTGKRVPIKNKNFWQKVKDLRGTEENKKKLKDVLLKQQIDLKDYWVIRAQWTKNSQPSRYPKSLIDHAVDEFT